MLRQFKWLFSHLSALVLFYVILSCWSQAIAKQEYKAVNWDSLDLSNQQRDSLNDLDEQWQSSLSEMAPRIQANERKLKLLMRSPKPNESDILKLQQQILEDKAKLKLEATQIFSLKRKLLKKEQEQKLIQMMDLY